MADDKLAAELAAIRDYERQATPGPWAWFGNTDTHSIYLATRQWGRFIVMGFRRWGTQGARPMFATGRTWKPAPKSDLDFGPDGRMTPASEMFTGKGEMTDADSLAVYAVAPAATSRNDPRVYRADLSGIRNPDAEFIARAREDVPRLLAAVEAALACHERVNLYGNAATEEEPGNCPHHPDSGLHFEDSDGSGEWLCEGKPEGAVCSSCVDGEGGERIDWPCPEYEAILKALTGKAASGG